MTNVQIITERLSSLSYQFAKDNDIFIFPANIIHGNEIFQDDDDKKATEFLKKLQTMEDIPSTAVPSPGEMLQIFKSATEKTDQALYISTSSKLSGLHSLGSRIAEQLQKEGKDIRVFDSKGTVSIEGMYAYKASNLAKEGKSIDEIYQELEKIQYENRITEYGVLETLKYLQKNGRIGKAKAWLAGLLSFKPIISAKEGELEPIGKVRTSTQGVETIIQKIRNDMQRLGSENIQVMYDYGLSIDFVEQVVHPRLQKEFHAEAISFNQISTAIACHMGPEIWGVALMYR